MTVNLARALLEDVDAPTGFVSAGPGGDLLGLEDCLQDLGRRLAAFHSSPIEVNGTSEVRCVARLRQFAAKTDQSTRIRDLSDAPVVVAVGLDGNLSPADVSISHGVDFVDLKQRAVGDPAVDFSHMMAGLMVMAAARRSCGLLTAVGSFHAGYAGSIDPPSKLGLFYRSGPLTAAFMLEIASRAPYLEPALTEDLVSFARWWLPREHFTVGQVRDALWTAVDMGFDNDLVDWRKDAMDDLMHREP